MKVEVRDYVHVSRASLFSHSHCTPVSHRTDIMTVLPGCRQNTSQDKYSCVTFRTKGKGDGRQMHRAGKWTQSRQ
ncbi:hypothetical protein LSAT2_010636 [Lamellibrachia satsuma]|nr:hypothetical protein LSAT2_010636 [Lamellibrachia satsuma]